MTDADLVAGLSDTHTVALTLYAEARGEPIEGRIAVANVIRNRVRLQKARYGFSPKQVCLKAHQFSCWLPDGGLVAEVGVGAAQLGPLAHGEIHVHRRGRVHPRVDGVVHGEVRRSTHEISAGHDLPSLGFDDHVPGYGGAYA